MASTTHQRSLGQKLVFIGGIVLIVLAAIGYIVYDTWVVQQKTAALLRAPGIITAADKDNPEKVAEGSDATEVTKQDFSNYRVEPNQPRLLMIDKIGVTARIRPMGLNSDKSIQAPKNIYDAGWYTGAARPGESGLSFIDGHASGSTRFGLFANLDRLSVGDIVKVERGDGEMLTYKVVHTEVVALADIDMSRILKPYGDGAEGLNLMTCTGSWVNETATLDHRVVVYTQRVAS